MRVLICSETTPKARKAAQASPAASPNLLVNVEAIQSVLSGGLVAAGFTGLGGFCCSDELVLSTWGGDGGC